MVDTAHCSLVIAVGLVLVNEPFVNHLLALHVRDVGVPLAVYQPWQCGSKMLACSGDGRGQGGTHRCELCCAAHIRLTASCACS